MWDSFFLIVLTCYKLLKAFFPDLVHSSVSTSSDLSFLWAELRKSILGQASRSPIRYRWRYITGTPLVMSLSLLLFGFLSPSFLEARAWPRPPFKEPSLGWETSSSISPAKKKKPPCSQGHPDPLYQPYSDKRLMSWHAHKIDQSFKHHTGSFHCSAPWPWIASTWHYCTLLSPACFEF